MTVEQPSKEPSGQKVLKSLVALSLSASLCPTAAFAAEGRYSEGDAAQTAQSARVDQAAPSQEITPQASLRATQEVTVGCLKYRIDTASKEACVIEYAVSWSNRPDNIIIPEKIEVGGIEYKVTAIGDEDDVSGGQICGKVSLTIPATVTHLYGVPFADTGNYYFLGAAPEAESTTYFMMWGGNETLDDGQVYCLRENVNDDTNYYSFNDWVSQVEIIYGYELFTAPTSVKILQEGTDKTGQTGEVPVGRTINLTAQNEPQKNAATFADCHTAIIWTSSNTEVATVKNGAVTVAAGAANGAQSVITATNALGQSASYTVVAQASSAKDIATVAAGQITIPDMFKGFVSAPSFSIKDGDYTLVADKDYTVSYETAAGEAIALGDIAAAGTYNMVVVGTGADYQGTLKVPFNVVDSLTAGDWKYAQTAEGEVSIVGYTGAGAIATAPAKINGFAVTSVAADAFKGAAVAQKIVLPDTITSIDAYAFFGAVSPKVEFLGAAPSVTSGVVTLPSGMKVSYSDTFDGDAFTAVFGSGSVAATKDLWSYRVTLEGSGADVEKSAAIEAAQGSAYRGAWGDTLAIDVPSEIDGYVITCLGANALGSASAEGKLALVNVPSSITSIGDGALTGLSATIRFEGACPDADSPTGTGASEGTAIYYPASQDASWKDCSWANPKGSFDDNWKMAFNGETKSWSVAGYVGSDSDLAIPNGYCGYRNVAGISAGAFDGAAKSISKLTIPDTVESIAKGAFANVDCGVYFQGEPPEGADFATEFTGADGLSSKKTMYYPIDRMATWTASAWVTSGNYTFESYGDCNAANYEYKSLGDGKYEIVKYLGGGGVTVQIPSTIDGIEVTVDGTKQTVTGTVSSIAGESFNGFLGITSIIIPETVESIGNGAFFNCRKLSTVDIRGNGLRSIDERAFWNCTLATIDLPASVESIGHGAFISQTLTAINVDANNAHYSSVDGVLYSADKQTLEAYPMGKADASYTVLPGTKTIADQAFRGGVGNRNTLAEVVLPDGLESIGWRSFAQMYSLASIDIPDTVTMLGTYAFSSSPNLKEIKLPAQTTAIPEGFAQFCDKLATVELPATLKTIGEWAFTQTSIAAVSFPEGLESIGANAYEGAKIVSLTFPESLTEIGDHAFYIVDELENLDLKSARGLKTLGIGVFAGCRGVKSFEIPNNIEKMGNAVFGSMSALENVTFESGSKLTELPYGCFENDYSITTITIPASIEKVGDMAFYNCMGLKDTGSVVFLNRGEWTIYPTTFCYGNSFEYYVTNIYGYRDSSSATVFADESLFHPIDVDIAEDLAQDEESPEGMVSFSSALVTLNGDIKFIWYVDGEEVARTDEGHLDLVIPDYEEDHDLRLAAYNTYDPDFTVDQVISFRTPEAPKASIEGAEIAGIARQTYTGQPIMPLPKVMLDGATLAAGIDYELSYADNTELGVATVTVTGIGKYEGSASAKFVIGRAPAQQPVGGEFIDVPRSGEWFSAVVYEAVDLGLMGGYTPEDGGAPIMFGAYDSLTRGQLALVLYRMVNGEEPDGAAANETTFADNPDAQYFTAAVNWAAKEGILKGSKADGKTLVRPNDPVTRQELATMIYRFAQAQGVDMTADSSALADKTDAASIADWALDAVTWTSSKGILGGYDNHDGTFTINPDGETARVEAAKVLVTTYKLLIDSKF